MKTIDLVLSGSGVRLPAHAGALTALLQHDFQIKRIAGTSGGAIIAAAYAAGLTPTEMKTLVIETDFGKLVKGKRFGRMWRFFKKLGLYSGNKFEQFVKDEVTHKTMREFENLTVISSDIFRAETVIINSRSFPTMTVHEALRKSMSIPFYFIPQYRSVAQKERCFVDGGVTNNYAIDIFDDHERPTLGVLLIGQKKPCPKPGKMGLFEFAGKILDSMMCAVEHEHIEDAKWAKTIDINTGFISSFDFDIDRAERQHLYDEGLKQTNAWIKRHPDI